MSNQSLVSSSAIDAGIARKGPARRARRIVPAMVAAILTAIDSVAVLGTGCVSLLYVEFPMPGERLATLPSFLLVAVFCLYSFRVLGVYRANILMRPMGRPIRLLIGFTCTAALSFALFRILGPLSTPIVDWFSLWGIGAATLLLTIQGTLAILIRHWQAEERFITRIGLAGAGPIARRLLRKFETEGQGRIRIVGVYDDEGDRHSRRSADYPIRGGIDDLVELVRRGEIDSVVIALPLADRRPLRDCLSKLQSLSVDVCLCPDEIGVLLGPCRTRQLGGVTFLNAREKPLSGWNWLLKQLEDRVLAAFILIAISPLMAAIALLIKLDSAGPVFFRQKRYGLNNELIGVFKFRTMYDRDRDPNCEQQTVRNDPRVTQVGNFLRRTSLDELPQLINVLRGDMSLVGPRPHAISSKAAGVLFNDAVPFYHARHRVKPGITGWAQVNGWRGETTSILQIKKRTEHDIFYIENWSLSFDFLIMFRTLFGGFTGRNAY